MPADGSPTHRERIAPTGSAVAVIVLGDPNLETPNTYRVGEQIVGIASRQGLQCKYLAALLGSHGDAIGNRMPRQLIHRILIHRIQREMAVLGIGFQQPLENGKCNVRWYG